MKNTIKDMVKNQGKAKTSRTQVEDLSINQQVQTEAASQTPEETKEQEERKTKVDKWIDDSCVAQGSQEWHKARLGRITSSCVELIIGKGRAKDSIFSETGKKYLYKLAAERNLSDRYKTNDDCWLEYLDRTNFQSKAMQWGTDNESVAREVYKQLNPNYEVTEVGFIHCGYMNRIEVENYGDSPDGVVVDNTPSEKDYRIHGCIEIKCPTPETWMTYKAKFKEGLSLKEIEPKYYWQCQSHMFVLGAEWCDFIYFDKMQKDGFQCHRIYSNEEDIKFMISRILKANEFVDNLLG